MQVAEVRVSAVMVQAELLSGLSEHVSRALDHVALFIRHVLFLSIQLSLSHVIYLVLLTSIRHAKIGDFVTRYSAQGYGFALTIYSVRRTFSRTRVS